MSAGDDFFIGWSAKTPATDRRILLAASAGLLLGAAAAGAGFAMRTPGPGPGRWDQGAVTAFSGVAVNAPHPTLLTRTATGDLRPMLMVGYGKAALPRLPFGSATMTVMASAITRGAYAMLAVQDAAAYVAAAQAPANFAPPGEEDLGEATLIGEILDAKCWFGAMNPGVGLTHKACAALCAKGGLPLAFSVGEACGGADEPCLFLDESGAPHRADITGFVADPVFAVGRRVRRNGILEFRVAAKALRRV